MVFQLLHRDQQIFLFFADLPRIHPMEPNRNHRHHGDACQEAGREKEVFLGHGRIFVFFNINIQSLFRRRLHGSGHLLIFLDDTLGDA